MGWLEVKILLPQEAIEPVSALLINLDITGLVIEDEKDFDSFLQQEERSWDYIEDTLFEEKKRRNSVSFYLKDDEKGQSLLRVVQEELHSCAVDNIGISSDHFEIVTSPIYEKDWKDAWKQYFKPLPVGKQFMIKPSWETVAEAQDRFIIEMDPGQAFGTGAHESTQLCIEFLETLVQKGDRLLDIGTGSGILSIAALYLGAEKADGLDVDPNTYETAIANARVNGFDKARYENRIGNLLKDTALLNELKSCPYDLITANIAADIVMALSPQIGNLLQPGGKWIASGIINTRLDEVAQNLKNNGFIINDIKTKNDWCAICVSKSEVPYA